ncbi:MAG: hypothetical protein AAGB48_04515 [Planctomycetota bacterium]
MKTHKISESYSRLRRRMWWRLLLCLTCLVFFLSTLVLDFGVSRVARERWIYASGFLLLFKIGHFEGPMNITETKWNAYVYPQLHLEQSWSDYYGDRLPSMLPTAWATGSGWINILIPIWPLPTFFLLNAGAWWLLARRERNRYSCRCGYSYAGLSGDTCPECGRSIAPPANDPT